jgi:hypothetical protein
MSKNSITTQTRYPRKDKQHIRDYREESVIDQGDRITRRIVDLHHPEIYESNYPKQESGHWCDIWYGPDFKLRKSLNDDKIILVRAHRKIGTLNKYSAYDMSLTILKHIDAVTEKTDFKNGQKYVRYTVRTRRRFLKEKWRRHRRNH